MPDFLSQNPLTLAIATLIVGVCIVILSHHGSTRMDPIEHARSIRASCSGLLLVGLAGIQVGIILLDTPGWVVLGVVLLLASVTECILMAIGALATPPIHEPDMPHAGPWDDDPAIH